MYYKSTSIWLAEETLDEVEITGKQEENTEISQHKAIEHSGGGKALVRQNVKVHKQQI